MTNYSTPEPPPKPGVVDVWTYVVLDLPSLKLKQAIIGRVNFGHKKYGTLLQVPNGRNYWIDTLQELLDAIMYSACMLIDLERHGQKDTWAYNEIDAIYRSTIDNADRLLKISVDNPVNGD